MTSDPARHLADVGCRLLRTARPFLEAPVPQRLPEAYNDALLDPLTALAGVCDGLLLAPHLPPGAERHGGAWAAMSGTPEPDRDARAPAATPAPGSARYAPHLEAWDGPSRTPRAYAGPTGPSLASVQAIGSTGTPPGMPPSEAPGSRTGFALTPGAFPDASVPWQENKAPAAGREDRGPVEPGHESRLPERESRATAARRPADRPPADGPRSVAPEDQPTEGGATYLPVPRARQETRRADVLSPAPQASADPAWGDFGRGLPGSSRSADVVRLASDPRSLAALLQAHAAEPAGAPWGDAAVSLPQTEKDDGACDPVGGSGGAGAGGRIGIEEVVERLADELETEFVRTYGSSGV